MKLSYDKANEPITRKEQQSQPPISIASEWTAPTVDNIAYPCWQGNAIRLYSSGFCPMPRPKGHGPFTKCCTALSEANPQKPTFGCKQLSGCIHGAPPHTPPKGTFCKKSPWESRKTAFDFYCLVFHRLLSRYQKTGVHAAYSPSASQRACSARCEINPQKSAFGCKQLSGHVLLPRYQKAGVHAAGF